MSSIHFLQIMKKIAINHLRTKYMSKTPSADKNYLVDHVNMFSITRRTTPESSWQFSISENCIKLCASLFLLPFLITLEPLSSGLHLNSSLPFSSLTISASKTPFILLWRQANLVLCVCSLPQKPPGLPVSPASSTSWWNPYWPFCW